jgi:Na+-driven multidrug efflux pump
MFTILRVFSPQLLSWIIDSPSIYSAAMDYIHYRQFGIVFVCFNFLFRSFYVGISNTKVITFSTVLMAIVNIFLDYCLIFGNLGFSEMGVGGAALASFAAEVAATLFFAIYTFFAIPRKKYCMFQFHKMEAVLMHDILKIAFPTMIQRLFSFGAWFIFFVLIEKTGETAIGVSSIIRSVYMILIIPSFAFASTANTLTSRIIGEGHPERVMGVLAKVVKNSLFCCLPLVLICALIPDIVVQIYTDNLDLAFASVPAVYVICVATIFSTVAMAYFEAVSGTGNTSAALYLEFGILIIYILFILMMTHVSKHIEWVWTAEWLYNLCIGTLSVLYLRKANWMKKKI